MPNGENPPERRLEDHWHLDKKISLVHLVTTFGAILTAVLFLAAQQERISLVEKNQTYFSENLQRLESQQRLQEQNVTKQVTELRREINDKFSRIDSKLDKIMERELDR